MPCPKSIAALAAVFVAAASPALAAQPADAIWTGGPIVTVNDAQPSAEAVAVRGGAGRSSASVRAPTSRSGSPDRRRSATT